MQNSTDLAEEVVAPSSDDILTENRGASNEKFDVVQLEHCADDSREVGEDKKQEAELWTTCDISKKDKPDESNTVSQSPVVSEITPVEEDEQQETTFLNDTAPIKISVSNPKKSEEVSKLGIRSTFTSYFIQSETSLPDFPFTKRAVWRRFKDFDTLHRLLRENHRGYIIPALPSKNFFESKRGNEAFIKERQLELHKFLRQVAFHKNLYNTDELKVFLGHPEDLAVSHEWRRLIDNGKQISDSAETTEPTDLDKPAETMKRDVATLLKKVGKTIRNEMIGQSYTVSETEKSLQDTVPQLKQLEVNLGSAVEKSQNYLTVFGNTGNELGLLGRVWVTISRFEEDYISSSGKYTTEGQALAKLVTVLHKAGHAAVRVQQIRNKSVELLKARLMALTDHLNTIPSMLQSLQDRTLILRHLNDAQNQLEVSRRSLDNLTKESNKKLGGTVGYGNRSATLSAEIRTNVEAVSKRTELYDTVTQRNLSELDRQNNTREKDLQEMALAVAKMEQECYETVALIWVNLAEEITQLLPEDNNKDYHSPQ